MTERIVAVLTVFFVVFTAPALAESPDEVYSFADHLKRDGMFEAAAQQYLKFARENPVDRRAPVALEKAADCLAQTGEPERAITVLETITTTYPDDADICAIKVRLGGLYMKVTRFEAADRVYTNVVVSMPECSRVPDALLGKGEALMALNNHAAAAEVFSSLIGNFLESGAAPRASFHLAYCQKKLGRPAQALNTYQKVVIDFPGNPLAGFASLEAARMFVERGDTAAAIDFYRNAKRYETKTFFVPASQEGAALLGASGRHDEALAWYEELLARQDLEDPRTVFIQAAEEAYHARDFDGVRRITDEYGARYPKTFSPQITYVTALTGLERSEFDRAIRDADELETFAPGTEWSRRAPRIRGDALLEMGRPRDAILEWRRFVSLSQDSLARVTTLGRMADVQFSVTRDTTAALATLTEQLDVERRSIPPEMLRVAGVFERAEHYQGARDLYADLVERFPLTSEAESAVARIEFLDQYRVTDYQAAARAMDRTAFEVARMNDWDGLLSVIDARINTLKDFDGALALSRQIKKSSKKTQHYPRVLYLEGLSRAQLSLVAHHTGRDDRARDEMNEALKPWNELTKEHGATEWAAQAASMRIVLRSEVEGVVDTSAVKRVLARYPEQADRATLTVMMGDYFFERGDAPQTAQRYYREALTVDKDNTRNRYKWALALAQDGQDKEAFEAFKSIGADDDGRVGLLASYEAGRSLRRLKRYDDAVDYFDRVAQRDPAGAFGANAMLQAADCRYMQKDYERALTRYTVASRQAQTPQRAWEVNYRIGLCLRQLNRPGEALAKLEQCLAQPYGGAVRSRVYRDAAVLAASEGDVPKQAAILENYVTEIAEEDDKDVAAASRELVRLLLRIGDTEKATVIAEWIEEDAGKDDAEAKALLAMTRYRDGRSGDGDKLRRDVEKIAGVDSPFLDEIGVEAAKYYYDQQSFNDAVQALSSFAGECNGPGACEEARFYYSVSLMGANQVDKSIDAAQKFFRDYPLSAWGPKLHLKLGNVLVRESRVSESLLHYEEAAATTADSATAFMALKNMGIAYQDLKRWRDSERVWTQILNRFPGSDYAPEAALNIARSKMEYGDYRGAISAYEKSLPMLDSDTKARAFYWMGTSYERLGDDQSAVVQYLKVPYLASGGGLWVVTAELKAAECYTRIDRNDAAREIYNRVIQKYGAGSNWGKLARRGLDGIDQKENEQSSNTSGSNQ
jgi:TolA-binding protein